VQDLKPNYIETPEDYLATLILPLTDRRLIIPNIVLAEIIEFIFPKTRPGLPNWLLGHIFWRGLNLPLLSFELASGGKFERFSTSRIAVLNALAGNNQRNFIALILRDIPTPARVSSDLKRASMPSEKLELSIALIDNNAVSIPDLVGLENLLDTIPEL